MFFGAYHLLYNSVFTATLCGRYHYYPHFIAKESHVRHRELKWSNQDQTVVNGRARIQAQADGLWNPSS